jgi:hypothetical protein
VIEGEPKKTFKKACTDEKDSYFCTPKHDTRENKNTEIKNKERETFFEDIEATTTT